MELDLSKIPQNPGCYLFKNSKGKVIYVGKAKNLSKRVKSYFQKKKGIDSKTEALVSHISHIEFFVTDSEVESLLLENNLIKKYQPKYNINLKDSKRYAFIQVTREEYPRLLVARKRGNIEDGKFYGPFVSGMQRDYIVEALRKIFKIRTCKKLPKRACLRYAIGLCSAPCTKAISKSDYEKSIASAEMVLKGKNKELIKILETDMKEFSKNQDYERALDVRNQILAVKGLEEKQKMERDKAYDEDVIHFLREKDRIHIILFHSKRGILEEKQDFEVAYASDFLEEFLFRYYGENEIPARVLVPKKVDLIVQDYLEKLRGKKVIIEVPQKGLSKDLLDLALKNLEIMVHGDYDKIEDLAKELKLNEVPKVIECFDISHLSGTETVASMVQFRNGKADKSNYRRYKIKTVDQIDDFASMKEVVMRRYKKLKEENLPMPNLVIIDGGKGQLSAVTEVLKELNLKLVVVSLAKREEEIFVPGKSKSIILPRKGKALYLVQAIRDEAHRFAINYNRLRRKKAMFE